MSRQRSLPALEWLPQYRTTWLRADVVGGIAAGVVVVPQAMAYATIADLPVEVGLYTCMVPMAVYALLGGSRTASVSTTSTIAVLTGSTLIAADVAAGGDDPAGDLAMLTLLVGIVLLVARLFRIGGIVDNISEATLVGIKAGVGLTVAAGQLPKLLGVTTDPEDNFFSEVRALVDELGEISWVTVAFSAGTIAVLLVGGRLAPRIPATLVVVVAGILLVAVGNLDAHGIATIAEVPSGVPEPVAPAFDRAGSLLPGAFAIAIMAFLETVSVGRALRRPDEPDVDNNEELAANGVACVAGAFFRAMPSAGGFSQSAINRNAGARTQVSELVTVALAVACALFLGEVLADLPEATLGCLVVVAVLGLIRPAEFVRFYRLGRVEFWVAVTTAGCGLLFGLLVAVLVGVLLTLFLVLRALDRIGFTELEPTTDDDDVEPAGARTRPVPGLFMVRLDSFLYAANVRSVNRRLLAAIDSRPSPPQILVVDLTAVPALPVSVIDEAPQLERELASRNVTLWLAGIGPKADVTLQLLPQTRELTANGRLHATALAAVRAYRARPPV